MSKSLGKGQSTLEYVIILAAIIGAMVLVAGYVKKSLSGSSQDDETGGYQSLTKRSVDVIEKVSFDPKVETPN